MVSLSITDSAKSPRVRDRKLHTMSGQYTLAISIGHGVRSLIGLLTRIAVVVAQPVLRIALAVPFFRSGLTKWDDFLTLAPSASFLFEEEFKLHIFGQVYDFPASELLARHSQPIKAHGLTLTFQPSAWIRTEPPRLSNRSEAG